MVARRTGPLEGTSRAVLIDGKINGEGQRDTQHATTIFIVICRKSQSRRDEMDKVVIMDNAQIQPDTK